MSGGAGRVPTGFAAETFISESTFRAAQRGYGTTPSTSTSADANANTAASSRKRKRENKGDSGVLSGAGAYKGPWAKYEIERPDAASDEEYGEDVEVEYVYEEDEIEDLSGLGKLGGGEKDGKFGKSERLKGTDYRDMDAEGEMSEFVGSREFDYQGRTYMHVPADLDIKLTGDRGDIKNYHPKKLLHTFTYHTASITQTRFFPSSGHLLLSASADSKIALWDVYHNRELLRTFAGHTKSVNDIDFNPDGSQFLSASYDRYMKLWDTETGKCVQKFTKGKTPHVLRFNPSRPQEFLSGMADKKILQWDTRTGECVQEYDHHLGAVNTITFCDEDRRFVTTSDDKSLRAWEYNIPVPIKFIAEPYMFSLVRSSPHPSGKYIAFQSSDNQIVVYSSSDRFRQNRKKSYRGHNVAGYAPDVAISPDGGIVASGDSGGFVCFWDWKTCKMWHKIKVGEAPVLSVQWHPRETSKVVTGDLEGRLMYWD